MSRCGWRNNSSKRVDVITSNTALADSEDFWFLASGQAAYADAQTASRARNTIDRGWTILFDRRRTFSVAPGDIMNTELTARLSPVEGKKEALIRDLKAIVGDADGLLKEMANASVEGFVATRTRVEGKMGEAKARLDAARTAVAARAKGAADTGHAYARDNPWKVLGASAVAGLFIGFLLRRR
jgi:ElaB/YqjD/DUF883 family membrane-anchored ribosome-binding protein